MFRLKAYWIYLFLVAKFAGMVCSSKAEHIIRRGPVSDPHCMSPLTNSKDEFPDSAFSASSVLQNRTEFQPYQARMTEVYGSKEHTSGHAWCPDSPSEDSLREWIQAEFSELVYVRAIYTAGRGDGNVKEFMPNFVLKYQREDGGAWYEHQKRDGSRILKANSDPRNLARATLETTVIAKRIRIYPFSRKASQQVCLRFSLYGCKFPDGVVSYSIPQGGIISRDRSYLPASDDPVTSISENFKDLSYDGQLIGSTNQLTDGLGQLMDNVAYFENVTTPSDMYPAQPGFHFVGWYQPGQTDVQILFKFDRIRKFTWLRLFTYDSIQLRARLISRATISFSMDGVNYGNSIEIPTGRAQLSDFGGSRTNSDQMSSVRLKRSRTATPVRQDPRIYTSTNWDGTAVLELDLNNRVGRFVKVTLTTSDSWILLSEVQFNSTIATDIPPQTVGKSAADKEPVLLVQGEGTAVADPKREVGAKVRPIDTPLSANEQAGDSRAGVFEGDTTPRDSISPMRDREADKNEFGSSSPGLSIIMPFIIAIVILIFALPTIVLIWICSRKRCRRSRSGCHRKVLLADGGRSGPMGGMHHLGDGTNSMTVQEATKLLNSYSTIPSSLRPDGTIVIPTQVCLANGTHASTTNVTHVTSNGLGGLGGATVSPLAYPPPPPAPPPPPGVGVILPCSPSSSSSSHTNGDNQAAVPAVSNIAPSLQPNSFLTAANPDGSNMYSGTEGSCMSGGGGGGGMVSLSAQPTNMQPTCFVPAFIALPTSSPAGAFILQPVGFGQPPQLFGRLPPGGQASFGTPDSGSLYTSIRTSAQQLEQPTSVISVEGESERDTKGGVKQQGCNKTHGQPGRLEGEDTDEDVTELHEEVADHTRVEEEEKHRGNDEAPGAWIRNSHKNAGKGNAEYRPDRRIQCGKKNEGNAPKDESDQKSSVLKFAGISPDNKISGEVDNYLEPSDYLSKLIAGPRSGRNDRPRHRPISQQFPTSISRSSRRDSGLSLPDGEESQPYCNLLLSHGPSKQGIPVRIIRQTPAGLIVQPCGPEYASASLFGMTPPPSDLSAGLPAASSENAPGSVPRVLPPTYAVSFACPIQGLGTAGMGGIYTGPASVPVTAATLRPASRHMTPNPTHRFQPSIAPHTAGLLFLPQSAYKGSRSGDPSGFYQVGGDINDRWIFPPGSNMGSVITNGPKGTWFGDANPTILPNPVTLMSTTSPGCEGLEMPHPSPHISPQHYFTSQLVFPAMPPAPCSSMAPAFNGSHMEMTFPRGSPVGAAANMNPLVSINEAGSRDGTSSGRLSLYSVCI